MEQQRDKVIAGRFGIPVKNLANLVRKGVITLDDIGDLPSAKLEQIKQLLAEFEEEDWSETSETNTVKGKVNGYKHYLECYPNGNHAEEAKKLLADLEDSVWNTVLGDLTKESLEGYSDIFPDGKYIDECDKMLGDLPFLEVLKRNTIDAYQEYMKKYPGRHDEECLQHIEEIEDENDWKNACANNTREAYMEYLKKHPNGKHAKEAKERIKNRSQKEIFIGQLREDPNCYPPNSTKPVESITTKVEDGVATWDDLLVVFEPRQIEAIKNWKAATDLPPVPELERLSEGFTEVYFWGTKGTGKTCVIGSLLGSLVNKKKFVPVPSPAEPHRQVLTNLFSGHNDNIITLPDSTKITNLPAMPFLIRDEKQRKHPLMLIDMAGEAFTGIYKKKNRIKLTTEEETAVSKIEKYLKGKQRNDKIHFFVVEYDGADKVVDPVLLPGVTQLNVLENVAAYFQEEHIFERSSVGVYVVITKCDRIKCEREERAKEANKYVTTGQLANFTTNLREEYAERNRIGRFMKISFSIGKVFAQNLCIFDDADTEKIIEELILKSPWISGEKWWEKVYGWLNYK